MFGAGRGWGTGRGGGRGGFHRGGGRGMAGGGRGRGGEVFGSKKMVKVGGELVEKQPHVPLRGGGSGAPRGGMARSTGRGCGVVAGGSSSSSSSRGGISSSLPRGRGSSWKPPPKPASSHQAAQADRVFESKKMVRVGDKLYSKSGDKKMTKAGTGGGSSSSSSRTGAAARRPARGSMARRAERGSGWTRGGWAGSGGGGGAGGRSWVSRGRPLFIPRGKLRGRGRGAFRQRAGVVRLFSNPIKEARARLLRGGRKGIIGKEARFRSRKMVKGGISKPARGGPHLLPASLSAPRTWIVTIGGVKYRKEANKKALVRVTDGAGGGGGSRVASAGGTLVRKPADPTGGAFHGPAGGRGGERVRIAGILYERSKDGHHLTKCKPNKTLNLAKERARKKLKEARDKAKTAAKQKLRHCSFYTRLGKCNRKDCPFMHDPTRVAVCKMLFLHGECTDKNCPFSHKIVQGNIPVCEHFLRGMCVREDCPYRHIKVSDEDRSDPLLQPLRKRQKREPARPSEPERPGNDAGRGKGQSLSSRTEEEGGGGRGEGGGNNGGDGANGSSSSAAPPGGGGRLPGDKSGSAVHSGLRIRPKFAM